jgi:hypothetical protein
MSIEVRQLIIKTSVKDDNEERKRSTLHLQASVNKELDRRVSNMKQDLMRQIKRAVEQQIRKSAEP